MWSQALCNAWEQGMLEYDHPYRIRTYNPHWLWNDQYHGIEEQS
jgi:hypothetical protein